MAAYKFEKLHIIKKTDVQRDKIEKYPDVYQSDNTLNNKPTRLFFSSPCLLSEFEDE